jgi:hypothetical protein
VNGLEISISIPRGENPKQLVRPKNHSYTIVGNLKVIASIPMSHSGNRRTIE